METLVVILAIIGGLAASVAQFNLLWRPPWQRREEENLVTKIKKLSASLVESAEVIRTIEAEMARRQALVDRLEQQKETAERVIQLSREQVEAIAQIMALPVKQESSRAILLTSIVAVGSGAFFFALGALIF